MEHIDNSQNQSWRNFVEVLRFSINNSVNITITYYYFLINQYNKLKAIH